MIQVKKDGTDAAPSREPTHLYQCCDCGRKSWDKSDELAHCNFPQPNGKRCAGQMLPIAPSREDRAEPVAGQLSAEQIEEFQVALSKLTFANGPVIPSGSNVLCRMALSSLRGTFADGIEAAAKVAEHGPRHVGGPTIIAKRIRALAQGQRTSEQEADELLREALDAYDHIVVKTGYQGDFDTSAGRAHLAHLARKEPK